MKKKENSFEKTFEQLENIVQDLETGEFSLDEALKKYELGILLARKCQEKIDNAKAKVELLLKKDDKTFEKQSFDIEK